MHGAVILELGHPAPGRERQAMELVNEFLERVEGMLADGRLAAFRWYGLEEGDLAARAALLVLEATPEQLQSFLASDEFRELRYAAPSFLQGFRLLRARPPDQVPSEGMSLLTKTFERWGLLGE